MLAKATKFREDHTYDPKDYNELKELMGTGWAFSYWCGDPNCEEKIKEDTKATIRCIPLGQQETKGKCIYCGNPAKEKAYFARAY